MNGMFWTCRQKFPAKFVVFDTYTQCTIFSSPRRGKCRHDNQRRQQVVVVESHRETLGLCVFLPIYVASTYRYLRRLSPCNFRANCTETRISLIYRTEPTTKKWKTEKVKSKKRICSEVSINSPGNPCSQSWRRKGRLHWFVEKEGFKPALKEAEMMEY